MCKTHKLRVNSIPFSIILLYIRNSNLKVLVKVSSFLSFFVLWLVITWSFFRKLPTKLPFINEWSAFKVIISKSCIQKIMCSLKWLQKLSWWIMVSCVWLPHSFQLNIMCYYFLKEKLKEKKVLKFWSRDELCRASWCKDATSVVFRSRSRVLSQDDFFIILELSWGGGEAWTDLIESSPFCFCTCVYDPVWIILHLQSSKCTTISLNMPVALRVLLVHQE